MCVCVCVLVCQNDCLCQRVCWFATHYSFTDSRVKLRSLHFLCHFITALMNCLYVFITLKLNEY